MTGIGAPRVAILVAEKLWEMCWQYVGPEEVPLGKGGEQEVLGCLAALSTLAEFNGWCGHGKRVTDEIARVAEQFLQVSLWYSNKRICDRVIKVYNAALKACRPSSEESPFAYGQEKLLRSLRRVRRMLLERHSKWIDEQEAIDRILRTTKPPALGLAAKKASR